jgi:predicted outer membrane protein
VELSKLALERAQNPQVKQFAQQLIADHHTVIQKLQPLAGAKQYETSGTARPHEVQQTNFDTPANTSGQPVGQAVGQMPTREQTPGLLAQPGAQPGQPGQVPTRDQTPGIVSREATQFGQASALGQVAAIEKQIGDRILASAKQKLEQKQGAEFDQCYLGGQIFCHMEMAAALEVLKDQTSGPLRQVIEEAQPKVKHHLTVAEQIGEQMMKASTRQADRPTTEVVPRVPR